MRGISFTALLISNLAFVVIAMVAVALVIPVTLIIAMVADVDALGETIEALKSSQVYFFAIACWSAGAAAIGAGFVAARLNRERPWLQSALALSASTLLYLFEFGQGLADPSTAAVGVPETIYLFVAPVLGMLGGYLAQKHQARLDAMSPEERSARTFKAAAVAVLRWILAFPAAFATFSIIALIFRYVFSFLGFYAFIFAVVAAILAGTLVAPPAHRKFAGFLFIGLTLLIPFEEITRHAWFGGLRHAHAVLLIVNTLAAGIGYIWVRQMFPKPFATHPSQWWWILDRDFAQWSADERSARRGLIVTAGVIWLVLFLVMSGLLHGQGLDATFASAFAFVVALLVALMAARLAFALMSPELLHCADQNAALRFETRHASAAF
jgi:hypothetical protein